MSSKVIHVRLDDWAIVGCYDILQSNGANTNNVPASSIIRQVVAGLVRTMQNAEKIPTHSQEDLLDRLGALYNTELPEIDLEALGYSQDGRELETNVSSLATEVLRNMEMADEPKNLTQDVEIMEVDEMLEESTTRVNLLKQPSKSFDELQREAPKDRFIEFAAENDSLTQKAVAIIYTELPRDLWGSTKAEEMILSLLQKHEGTAEEQDT